MANIFRKKDSYIDRVNRSTFDLSFVNNLTLKFGAITPVCLLPASFGDSFQIDARFNLQLLPTVFPIQTQLYARLHFVYVRTRTLWKDWMSFFGGDESVTPPWIRPVGEHSKDYFSMDDLQTSTLADYLGIPTVISGAYGKTAYADYESFDLGAPISLKSLYLGVTASSQPINFPALLQLVQNSKYQTYFGTAYTNSRAQKPTPASGDWFCLRYSCSDFKQFAVSGSVIYFDLGFNFNTAEFGGDLGILLLSSGVLNPTTFVGTVSLVSGTLYALVLSSGHSQSPRCV